VLVVSFHESGETLYPGSGFETQRGINEGLGYNVNIPLTEDTDDEVYLYAFESLVPPLIESFKPDIVLAEIGCDTHKNDPLAHLCLTSNGYKAVIQIINRISPKVMALGAGGYNVSKTAALWTLAWAIFCGLTPQDQHVGKIGGAMYGSEMDTGTLDDEPFIVQGMAKELCYENATRVIQYIRSNIFPIHGI
jgi:acetoin utilization protein AcuC